MTDMDQLQQFVAKAVQANTRVFELQTHFFTDYARHLTETFSKLASAHMETLQEIAASADLKAAMEKNMSFDEEVRQQLDSLKHSSTAAYEELVADVTAAYSWCSQS